MVITVGVVAWVGISRRVQAAYPPILYSEMPNLTLHTMSVSCSSFMAVCKRNERFLLDGLYSTPLAEWSPNGDYIAVHLNQGWVIYPKDCLLVLRTCEPVPVKPAVQDVRVAWGPDGTTLASYATSRTVSMTIQTIGCWQFETPCIEKKIPLMDKGLLTELAWSADGNRMVFLDYVQNNLVWLDTACLDKPSGCVNDLHLIPVGDKRILWPSLSSDGRKALLMMDTANNDASQQLFRADLDSGAAEQITFRPGTARYPDWSTDERYVLFSGFANADSRDLMIYVMDLERHISLPLMGHEGRDLVFATWGYVK